jgi:hypothetical protein
MNPSRLDYLVKFMYGNGVLIYLIPEYVRTYRVAYQDNDITTFKYEDVELNLYVFRDLPEIGDVRLAIGYSKHRKAAVVWVA